MPCWLCFASIDTEITFTSGIINPNNSAIAATPACPSILPTMAKPSAVMRAGSQSMACQAASAARHSAGLVGWSAACALRRQ